MKTTLRTDITVADVCHGFMYNELEGKGLFVFRQVPSSVPAEIIPKMTSLPQAVKDVLVKSGAPITYQNQFCIVYPDNSLHGWQPSGSDALATDWEIHSEFVEARETVGTAKPL